MSEYLRFGLCVFFMAAGVAIVFSALLGVFRFRFVLNRMHSAAMIDSLGISCIVIGLMLACGQTDAILKLLAIVMLLWIGSPIASHLVSKLEVHTDKSLTEHLQVKERKQDDGSV